MPGIERLGSLNLRIMRGNKGELPLPVEENKPVVLKVCLWIPCTVPMEGCKMYEKACRI